MKLHEYFKTPGSLSVLALAKAIKAKQPSQIYQWMSNSRVKRPGAAYCVAIERETKGAVMRWDLRPHDWAKCWPELIEKSGAPRPK